MNRFIATSKRSWTSSTKSKRWSKRKANNPISLPRLQKDTLGKHTRNQTFTSIKSFIGKTINIIKSRTQSSYSKNTKYQKETLKNTDHPENKVPLLARKSRTIFLSTLVIKANTINVAPLRIQRSWFIWVHLQAAIKIILRWIARKLLAITCKLQAEYIRCHKSLMFSIRKQRGLALIVAKSSVAKISMLRKIKVNESNHGRHSLIQKTQPEWIFLLWKSN